MTVPPDLVFLQWLIDECGTLSPRLIAGGKWAGIQPKMFTHAIVTGRVGDYCTFDDNWCYSSLAQAKVWLDAWDGVGEPKGWFRNTRTGRRVARYDGELDGHGKPLFRGEEYVMR